MSTHTINSTSRGWKFVVRRLLAWDLEALTDREFYAAIGWGAFALLVVTGLFFTFVRPAPPTTVAITTGAAGHGYTAYALKYQAALKERGIELVIVESNGTMENLQRLGQTQVVDTPQGALPVMIGFAQGGVDTLGDAKKHKIESLASVGNEPVWVFHKLGKASSRLSDLRGKRVAVDREGSGSLVVSMRLLEAAGVTPGNTQITSLTNDVALEHLKANKVDAIVIIDPSSNVTVRQALRDKIDVMDFAQADGFARNFPWLRKLVIPRGALDLSLDAPDRDLLLVGTTANLVVSEKLHPSLSYLLLDVASEVHAPATLGHAAGDFPTKNSLSFPQSEESKRFFESGRPFFQKYLPFWLASLLERIMDSFVPFLLVGLPLIKTIPTFLQWRENARMARAYARIKEIEYLVAHEKLTPAQAKAELEAIDAEFKERSMNTTQISKAFSVRSQARSFKENLNSIDRSG
jgi:TRAP-type uncharacterized transport system substrate-binding protein